MSFLVRDLIPIKQKLKYYETFINSICSICLIINRL